MNSSIIQFCMGIFKAHALIVPLTILGFVYPANSQIYIIGQEQRNSEIAKVVTVSIECATQGSGFLVKREGSRYTVLTAWHVLKGQGLKEDCDVYTFDGYRHRVDAKSIKRLGDIDLAVVSFASTKIYATARMGDPSRLGQGDSVTVAGFPLSSSAIPSRFLSILSGKVLRNELPVSTSGYQIIYTNPTLPGMSGGPVFNWLGRVVGVHGLAETDLAMTHIPDVAVKTGRNMAMPVTFAIPYLFGISVADIQSATESFRRLYALCIVSTEKKLSESGQPYVRAEFGSKEECNHDSLRRLSARQQLIITDFTDYYPLIKF